MIETALSFTKRAAIWSAIDLVIVKLDGAALNDVPEDVGAFVEQLTAQHRRAISAAFDCSLLFARLQHSIMPSLGACKGVPASTPPASERTTNNNVSRLTTFLTIFLVLIYCQSKPPQAFCCYHWPRRYPLKPNPKYESEVWSLKLSSFPAEDHPAEQDAKAEEKQSRKPHQVESARRSSSGISAAHHSAAAPAGHHTTAE